ncbi:uncharacterized protein [Oscarella lobularis]|uniref:uncharacterized protein isoform X2 n=1 Tax=Oscarella lobularis TaxID=121494 RepID=UPI003313127F
MLSMLSFSSPMVVGARIGAERADANEKQNFLSDRIRDPKKNFRTRLSGCELITCHPTFVLVSIVRSTYRRLRVAIQFPSDYPDARLNVELKSKTVPPKVLEKLTRLCDEELKQWIGKEQVLSLLLFVKSAVDNNPFLACSDEVNYVKNEIVRDGKDEIKIRQKSGKIILRINEERYFLGFQLVVGENYPENILSVEVLESNFPKDLTVMFESQAQEIARRSATPPLKKNPKAPAFQPSPCIKEIASFLARECAIRTVAGKCHVCGKKALPEDPKKVTSDPCGDSHVERVYCGHFYHYKCLDKYLQTPPFKGGKPCLHTDCRKRIFHEKWKASRDPKLAEDRWAHQEAKRRELDEVVDFLGL